MPGGIDAGGSEGASPPRLSLWHRFLAALPHLGHDGEKAPLGERVKGALVKPPDPDAVPAPDKPETVEELEAAIRTTTDKERIIGLFAAPVGALVGILVTGNSVAQHPKDSGVYAELGGLLLVLSLGMLAAAWLRKRTLLGLAMALYGLDLFNLRYWGFGVPFLLFGSWMLARSYGLHRDLREATAETGGGGTGGRPEPNKRYTPRTTSPKKSASPKKPPPTPEGEQKAG